MSSRPSPPITANCTGGIVSFGTRRGNHVSIGGPKRPRPAKPPVTGPPHRTAKRARCLSPREVQGVEEQDLRRFRSNRDRELASKLLDYDPGGELASRFFQMGSTPSVQVVYVHDMRAAFQEVRRRQAEKTDDRGAVVVVTTMMLVPRAFVAPPVAGQTKTKVPKASTLKGVSEHSVMFLLAKDGKCYYFDPNGGYTDAALNPSVGGGLEYEYLWSFRDDVYWASAAFIDVVRSLLGTYVVYPTGPGVQVTHGLGNERVIGGGGYCMFYNKWIIDVLRKWKQGVAETYKQAIAPPFDRFFPNKCKSDPDNDLTAPIPKNTMEAYAIKTIAQLAKTLDLRP